MNSDTPPVVPIGLDAYREWHRWAQQRIGVRAYMRSTYDRTGHNRTADASHYLHQQAEDFNVTLDVEGSGVLYFVRTNHWHGSPWHYEIDGVDHSIEESTTRDPLHKRDDAVFLPTAQFPTPLTYTYATTHGADLNWVPMAFTERLRLAYSRTFYGTGYYIYHQFVPGARLSRSLTAWHSRDVPNATALDLLSSAGADLTPNGAAMQREAGFSLMPRSTLQLCELRGPPTMIRYFELSAPASRAVDFGNARLMITWDGRRHPSIDAPLDLFFGAGTLHNRERREWLVKALPMSIRFTDDRVVLTCQFPMPFFRSASIAIRTGHDGVPIDGCRWTVRGDAYEGPWNHVGYFHATYRDHARPRFGEDLSFLDTDGIEGATDWSGCLVGTSFVFTDRNVLTTLEGDPRFFFDDSRTPQVQGTGTEEWGGGGDYWGGRTMTLPLAGHPVGVVDARLAQDPKDLIHSVYRFLLADLMPFGRRARIGFEHGGENESTEHYRSVTHWYGLPSPSIVLTDTLDIGDDESEARHRYESPEATQPYAITSRYEWGPDHLPTSIAQPLAAPDHCVEFEFAAARGGYRIWVELKTGADVFDAAVWLEFNGDIGSGVAGDYNGSAGFLNVGRTPNVFRFQTSAPNVLVEFTRDGVQRLRVQPRIGCAEIGRVLLSRDRGARPPPEVVPGVGEMLLTAGSARVRTGAFETRLDLSGFESIVLNERPREVEIFPAETMQGRCTLGVSAFTLAIRPDNHGVLLRRTLDYQYANQRARVYIANGGEWVYAGVWYLAGSNTVYHSFPVFDGELGASQPVVITSNRRFRDDEFLLPVQLTVGRSEIRVLIEFAPRNPPLLPGRSPQPTAWSEIEYRAYSFVMPRVELD